MRTTSSPGPRGGDTLPGRAVPGIDPGGADDALTAVVRAFAVEPDLVLLDEPSQVHILSSRRDDGRFPASEEPPVDVSTCGKGPPPLRAVRVAMAITSLVRATASRLTGPADRAGLLDHLRLDQESVGST